MQISIILLGKLINFFIMILLGFILVGGVDQSPQKYIKII